MIYSSFQDIEIPLLAIGCMRLPLIDGDDSHIDEAHAAEIIDYAMEHGAHYFDTAWGYHGGNSETVVGKILKKYPRENFLLADKFPGYDLANMDKVEEIFEKQLEKCQVDYFDFYLIHNVCETNIDEYLNEDHGILPYLLAQKEAGRIKHLGFSVHGSYEVLERFLQAYGEHMEFCQLQINWIDWSFQKAEEKAKLAESYGLPIWVMEPLRGGKLASLDEADEVKLKELRPHETIPGWAFRFLQGLPNVAVILGGISTLDQVKANIATFEEEKPLNEEELATLKTIADAMIERTGIPCTACRYCLDHCPQELDIPLLLKLYNQRCLTGEKDFISSMVLGTLPNEKKPSACIGCKSCEAVCPQQLKIADALASFAEMTA